MGYKAKHEIIECEWCGREFMKTAGRQRCCSPACYEALRLDQKKTAAAYNARQRGVGFGISDPYADGRLRADAMFCPVI